MLYSTRWLQEYCSTPLPNARTLEDLLNVHAFEVEAIKKVKKDTVIDVDVLPNRAHDCLNHMGMMREIAAIQGKKIKAPKTKSITVKKGTLQSLAIRVESAVFVPRYAGIVVEGIQLGKSPKKVQEYLEAVGVNPINNIVDLTNFIMLEMGQPLHAFDYDTIQGRKMNIRTAKAQEQLETLDSQILKLPQGALVIEDANGLIDLAGIKGGKESGISENTKNIFLQAANFNAETIYKTKRMLKYTTQAADIYAHEIDPNLCEQALMRANQLLQEWQIGGTIVQYVDMYPEKSLPKHIQLDLAFVESLLGVSIRQSTAKKILQDLGFGVTQKGNIYDVEIPTRRLDVSIKEDLVEEIGRVYGYEKIAAVFPAASLIPPKRNYELHWHEMARDTLKQLGFTEIYNYSFIGTKDLELFAYSAQDQKNLIELENPISEDFAYLRDSLLEHLLKNIQQNQKKFEEIRIFETGKVFSKKNKKFQETPILGAILHNATFYNAKGVVDFLLESLGIAGVWYDDYKATSPHSRQALWHSGKSAEIKVGHSPNGGEIGFVGEISSQCTLALKITKPVAAIHIDLDKLVSLASDEQQYQPVSKFPSIIRDIAVLVPSQTKVIELMNIINTVGKELIKDIDLFDMYEGGSVPGGKKSLAFHIIYQSNNKTLEHKDIDIIHKRIIEAIEKNPAMQVRN